jgi:hypothetical protein
VLLVVPRQPVRSGLVAVTLVFPGCQLEVLQQAKTLWVAQAREIELTDYLQVLDP